MKKLTLNELRKIIQEMSVGENIQAATVAEQANKCVSELSRLQTLLESVVDSTSPTTQLYKQVVGGSYVRAVEIAIAKMEQINATFAKMH